MKQPHPSTLARDQQANATIDLLYNLITSRLAAAVTSWIEFDLTFAQLKAMLVLSRQGDLSLGELAEGLGTGKSATSILVQQLVVRGLVARAEDTGDRRRTVLRLTERGARLVAGRRNEREEQLRRWLAPLSDQELQGLQRGLRTLHDAMLQEMNLTRA